MATDRLYYNDSRLLEFDAQVVDLIQRDDDAVAVTLDRTAFYPTGGGQPNDAMTAVYPGHLATRKCAVTEAYTRGWCVCEAC